MSDDLHRLGATAGLPKVRFGKSLDRAGLQFLKPLQSFLIADVVRAGIQVLEERRNQLRAIHLIKLGSFFEYSCDL